MRQKILLVALSLLATCGALAWLQADQNLVATARAQTTDGGTGDFSVEVTTCGGPDDGTDAPVSLELGTLGTSPEPSKFGVIPLNNPGNRVPGSTDTYRFSWPTQLGNVKNLYWLRLSLLGTNTWCLSSFTLRWHEDVLVTWDSTKTQATGTHYPNFPLTGPITLSQDPSAAPANFIRFYLGLGSSSVGATDPDPSGDYGLFVHSCSGFTIPSDDVAIM